MVKKQAVPVSLKDIHITDSFWGHYMELIRTSVIPYQWEALNDRIEGAAPSYCMQNFRIAAGLEEGTFNGCVFQDSDVYKWLEAVAYSLVWHPDPELEAVADGAIDLIGKAQQPDGYLHTYYIITGLDKRFTNLQDHHELYCLGHLTEAAVAYYKATGKRRLLDIAIGYVNCAEANLGLEEGKKPGYPGHEVAEMALAALYDITGDVRHLKLAKYFIDQRGQEPLYFKEECDRAGRGYAWANSPFGYQYYQAGKPVREQSEAQGHAVRAGYLYAGMADVAAATGDEELFAACERLWKNVTERQMYITGAVGATAFGEAFTFDYDLPNDTVYGETCAAIALVFFARRMFEITKDSRYVDVLEQALYNGVISGMSMDGKKFFYVNPLEVVPEACEKDHGKAHVKPERQKWFGCACCPPNVARLLSSLGSYAYEQSKEQLFVNLYVGGDVKTAFAGRPVSLSVKTEYPWDGTVEIAVEESADTDFGLALRIPGWCRAFRLCVNGEETQGETKKGYVYLNRTWTRGDRVTLTFEMPVRLMAANPLVREDIGKAAVMCGPLVYCLEEADNGPQLQRILLDPKAAFAREKEEELLGGVVSVRTEGKQLVNDFGADQLYREYGAQKYEKKELKFIPYYSWANRGKGEMTVWVRTVE